MRFNILLFLLCMVKTMEEIFSLAAEMAGGMTDEEKASMKNIDINGMLGLFMKGVKDVKLPESNSFCGIEPPVSEFIQDDKSKDLHYDLNVGLSDLYNGKQKKISFHRKVTKIENGQESVLTEKQRISINILPGMKDGDVIRFPGKSDQLPGKVAGDVIITICEDDHDVFDREGDNLFLVKDVSLSELYSIDFTLTHMDGRMINVSSRSGDVLHTNDGIRKIVGEGMPINNSDTDISRGDLFVRFNLILPVTLDVNQISELSKITPPINSKDTTDGIVNVVLEAVTDEDMEKLEENSDDESDDDESDDDESEDSDVNSVNEDFRVGIVALMLNVFSYCILLNVCNSIDNNTFIVHFIIFIEP